MIYIYIYIILFLFCDFPTLAPPPPGGVAPDCGASCPGRTSACGSAACQRCCLGRCGPWRTRAASSPPTQGSTLGPQETSSSKLNGCLAYLWSPCLCPCLVPPQNRSMRPSGHPSPTMGVSRFSAIFTQPATVSRSTPLPMNSPEKKVEKSHWSPVAPPHTSMGRPMHGLAPDALGHLRGSAPGGTTWGWRWRSP